MPLDQKHVDPARNPMNLDQNMENSENPMLLDQNM